MRNIHTVEKTALVLLVVFLAMFGGGCGGGSSSNNPTGDLQATPIDAASIWRDAAVTMLSEGIIDNLSQAWTVGAYELDMAGVEDLHGKSINTGDLHISFTAIPGSEKVNMACYSNQLEKFRYYALFVGESGKEEIVDSIFAFDEQFELDTMIDKNTTKLNIALAGFDIDMASLPEERKQGPSAETGSRLLYVSPSNSGASYPVYVSAKDLTFDANAIAERFNRVIGLLAAEHPAWAEAEVVEHIQHIYGWNGTILESIASYLNSDLDAAILKTRVGIMNEFLVNMPQWREEYFEGLSLLGLIPFMYTTGLDLGEIVQSVHESQWSTGSGSAGFFNFCVKNEVTFSSMLTDYTRYCSDLSLNADEPGNFKSFLAQSTGLHKSGTGGTVIDAIRLATQIVSSAKQVVNMQGTQVLLADDMDSMNYINSRRQTESIVCSDAATESFAFEIVMDYAAIYNGKKLDQWKDKGYFIPNLSFNVTKCYCFFLGTFDATNNFSFPVNKTTDPDKEAVPEMNGRVTVPDWAFGIHTSTQIVDYKVSGKDGISDIKIYYQ